MAPESLFTVPSVILVRGRTRDCPHVHVLPQDCDLVSKFKRLRCLCNIWIWQRLIMKGRLNFDTKVASICLEAEFGANFQVRTSFSGGKSSAISMIFGRFLAKSPPSTCRRLAGERMLDVAEIWRSLEALCAGDNGNFFFLLWKGGGGGRESHFFSHFY